MFSVALTYRLEPKVVIYFIWIGLLLIKVGSNMYSQPLYLMSLRQKVPLNNFKDL